MFTGIIEEKGRIRSIQRVHRGAVLTIAAHTVIPELKIGESVSVSGVCLTVSKTAPDAFSSDLSVETLERTSLGEAVDGKTVNLERALEVGGRLGGHFIMGHVDGMGRVIAQESSGEGAVFTFGFPSDLERYLVYKGSIAVDGISLTIASLEKDRFTVAVVPHTLKLTNLGSLRRGDAVNLEVDILGKYLERFAQLGLIREPSFKWTQEYLKGQGF